MGEVGANHKIIGSLRHQWRNNDGRGQLETRNRGVMMGDVWTENLKRNEGISLAAA